MLLDLQNQEKKTQTAVHFQKENPYSIEKKNALKKSQQALRIFGRMFRVHKHL